MKIVVIDQKNIRLNLEPNSIKYQEQTIPFRLIDMLILNHKVELNSGDILKMTKSNITILLVSYNNTNFSIISSANTKNAELKEIQFKSLSRKLEFARYFVKNKILLHAKHLEKFDISVETNTYIKQIDSANSINELMGIEGVFAKLYFKHFFSLLSPKLHKGKRSKQPPRDPINAMLSYWYSLYYHIITTRLLSYGYEPFLGYLHSAFREHNALASDLLELFRADINDAVMQLFELGILDNQDFTNKQGVYLKFEGRKKVWKSFLQLVAKLKPKLDYEIAQLKKRIYETENIA